MLGAQAASAIVVPIMACVVLYWANGKDLGKWRNHALANCAGVLIIVITLFMCGRNMSSFISSLQALVGA